MSDIFASASYASKKTAPTKSSGNLFSFEPTLEKAVIPQGSPFLCTDHPIIAYNKTGSRYICNPPVTNTDEDYILLVVTDPSICEWFTNQKFVASVNDAYTHMKKDGFISYRRDHINLIATNSRNFYNNFVKATELAKEFNLTDKKHRIMLFEAMRAGKPGKAAQP